MDIWSYNKAVFYTNTDFPTLYLHLDSHCRRRYWLAIYYSSHTLAQQNKHKMRYKKSVRTEDKHLLSPPFFLSLCRNILLRYQQCAHAKHVLECSYIYIMNRCLISSVYVLIHSLWFLKNCPANTKILMVQYVSKPKLSCSINRTTVY